MEIKEIKGGLVILNLCQVQGPVQDLESFRMHSQQLLQLFSLQAPILEIIVAVIIIILICGDSSITTHRNLAQQCYIVQYGTVLQLTSEHSYSDDDKVSTLNSILYDIIEFTTVHYITLHYATLYCPSLH